VVGVRLAGGETLETNRVILATGASARDVLEALVACGATFEARPFAVGFRIEHPQALIDELRYGELAGHDNLPPADYRLTHNEQDEIGVRRGAYSYCMCPAGVIVPTPTRDGELCINGMSHAHTGRFANSAMVVTVDPADLDAGDPLAGVRLQQQIEAAGYTAGGGAFVAPAVRLTDFLAGRVSSALGATSYRRGLASADLDALVPSFVGETLRRALRRFDDKMTGFVTGEAQLIGVETRTASPVRVMRDEDLQSVSLRGLYPSGEGVGYGGGIASCALDGVRVAGSILRAVGGELQVLRIGA
jgi:uncharacterized FAD-dependent dehydrogenase